MHFATTFLLYLTHLQRATVVGLVISGFGLSAFLFSTIAHVIFPGDTSEFLLVLAVGTEAGKISLHGLAVGPGTVDLPWSMTLRPE